MTADFASLQSQLVHDVIQRVTPDQNVKRAFAQIPRHLFVPSHLQLRAYEDVALPIAHHQTISQPSLVAEMLTFLHLNGRERVLEVGTGSGYQAALLSLLAQEVFTIEIIPELARQAQVIFHQLHLNNIQVRVGDGSQGWPEHPPFDAIILAASGFDVPQPLQTQLRVGGTIVLPLIKKDGEERLIVGIKTNQGLQLKSHYAVRFVPLTGGAANN